MEPDQTQETPPPQDPAPAGGKPGFFQSVNGAIAGVTGLVVAIGGLAATWDRIFPSQPTEAVAASPANTTTETVPADETAAIAGTEDSVPGQGDPTLFKGEHVASGAALTIEWDGANWVLTEGKNQYSYDDLTSDDPSRYEAVSSGSYLRWPIEGGEVDESEDRVTWTTYGSVEPVAQQ